MQTQHLRYEQYFLLEADLVIEVLDETESALVKDTSDVMDKRLGKRKISHWRRCSMEQLTPEQKDHYWVFLQAEHDVAPVKRYTYEVDAGFCVGQTVVTHVVDQYADHWVYHVVIPHLSCERVIVARTKEDLLHHPKGIGGLLYVIAPDV